MANVQVTRNEVGRVTESRCGDCGYRLRRPDAYHPPAFCTLVKAGFDPEGLVRQAFTYIPFAPTPYDPMPEKKESS